ncbi:MAG TPA: PIN domain-containing protein [Caulobacteraceae bacterium]|jgi:predicted nucleic acid-binding protein|nr:PIN domain-containing protein [Caulobacteraceae bacterium]
MTVFVDSTTLLYTLDRATPQKQAISAQWLKALRTSNQLVLSAQVLTECYAVVRRKAAFGDVRAGIRAYLSDHAQWVRSPLTVDTAILAWRLEDRYATGWWDAILLASATEARCSIFLTEDLNDQQAYGDVRVLNPFNHEPSQVLASLT